MTQRACPSQAFLSVAPRVAQFAEYRPALAQHLITRQLGHWERPLRMLAACALGALVPADPATAAGPELDQLLPLCMDPCLEVGVVPWAIFSTAKVPSGLCSSGLGLWAALLGDCHAQLPPVESCLRRGHMHACRYGMAHCWRWQS